MDIKSPYLCIVLIKAIDCFTFKNFKTNEKVSFHARSFRSYFFRFLGNKTDNNAATTDSDSATAVDSMNDSVKADSTKAADSVKTDSATQTPAA